MDFLGAVLGLGGLATGLFAKSKQRQAYDQQAAQINILQARTQSEMVFNQQVAEKTGIEGVDAILEATNQQISQTLVDFSTRGVLLDGSPMIILGKIEDMGTKKAQQFYFNTKVDAINRQSAGIAQLANYQAQKIAAKSNSKSATLGILADTINFLRTDPQIGRLGGNIKTGNSSSIAANQGRVQNG
jgi:hypothetical protein